MMCLLPRILLLCSLVGLGLSSTSISAERWLPRSLGSFYLKDAAFIEAIEIHPAAENYADRFTLYFTTFNPIALYIHDPVYRLNSPGTYLNTVDTWDEGLQKLGPNGGENTAYWPNQVVAVPPEVNGFQGILQTSGFLAPGKKFGQLEVYNEENYLGPWDIASSSEVEWSYHWVMWHDVDDDGLMDCMAARFNVDFFGNTKSEFVWMKNPGDLKPDGTGWTGWEQHVLIENGPDVHVTMHTLEDQGQNYSVIVTGELWTNRVMLYYVWDKPGAWSDPANIQSVVIEPDCGTIFEANAYDINADGKLEILASCTDGQDGKEGNFYLYTLPDNWRSSENWERKLLAGNFKPFQSTFNPKTMSPGKFKIFYPSLDYESQTNEDGSRLKPWISLSGDDDGKHYLLYPQSEDKSDWNYDIETIIDTGADTSGTMAIMDLDGDGYQELISAGYSADKVYVHTFSPNP